MYVCDQNILLIEMRILCSCVVYGKTHKLLVICAFTNMKTIMTGKTTFHLMGFNLQKIVYYIPFARLPLLGFKMLKVMSITQSMCLIQF